MLGSKGKAAQHLQKCVVTAGQVQACDVGDLLCARTLGVYAQENATLQP